MSGALLTASLLKKLVSILIDLGNNDFNANDSNGNTVTATFSIVSSGAISWGGTDASPSETEAWLDSVGSGNGDPFHARLVYVSGTNSYLSGSALSTWFAMDTTRSFNFRKLSGGGPELATGQWRLDCSDDGGSTTHSSQQFQIDLFEESP